MGIAISIYDFFAQAIPGGFALSAIFFIFKRDVLVSTNLTKFSIFQLIILGAISYILGYAIEPISKIWYRLFSRKNTRKVAIEDVVKNVANLEVDYDYDWYTLFAFIKRSNLQMAQEIERFNVTSIMLRKVSLVFILFSLIFAFYFIFADRFVYLVFLSAFCIFISISLVKESIKFKDWFYSAIYKTVTALLIEPKDLPVKFN